MPQDIVEDINHIVIKELKLMKKGNDNEETDDLSSSEDDPDHLQDQQKSQSQ